MQGTTLFATNTRGYGLISRNQGSAFYYYIKDGHGDVTKILDANRAPVSYYKYDAYGKQIESQGTVSNPYRYSGEYFDEESGLIYLRARYYNPENMRFITEDTYAGRLNDPLTLNLYGYCNGNPIYTSIRVDMLQYLDGNGNPVPYGSNPSHLLPK